MSPLLAPVLAQLITLQLADRTEARYVKYDIEQFEGSTIPRADLALSSGRLAVSLGYGPTLTLQPLEKKPRELLVFHEASANAGYRWRRTGLTLSSSFGLGEVNFRLAALQGSGPPGAADGQTDGQTTDAAGMPPEPGAPTTPTQPAPGSDIPEPGQTATGQLRVIDQVVRYYTSTTTLTLDHQPVREVELSAQVGHTRGGGLGESRAFYQQLSGWFVGGTATHTYALTSRDSLVANAALTQNWSSNDNRATTLNAQENWLHTFNRRTFTGLGAGLNITRFAQETGLRGFSIFPTFQTFLSYQLPLLRGTLSMTIYGYSSPALDPLRALVDPRVGVGGNLSYVRRKFSLSLTGNTALSLAHEDNDAGAIDTAQAEGSVAYQIGELVSVDTGARYARQAVQDVTVLPSSYAAFVGLNVGYLFRIHSGR